jgi:hypothetical protein
MNTYAKCATNPCGMRTSKIVGLKVSCNEHLQKNGGRGGLIVTQRPPTARSPRQVGRQESGATSGHSSQTCARPQGPRRAPVSSLRSLLPTPDKKVTLAFPAASALFARSFAQERKSTPLLSTSCARFCRNGGWGANQDRKSPSTQALSSRSTRRNRFGRPGSGRRSHKRKAPPTRLTLRLAAPYSLKTGIYSKPRRRSHGRIRGSN